MSSDASSVSDTVPDLGCCSSSGSVSSFDTSSYSSSSTSGYTAKMAEFHHEMKRLDLQLTKEYRIALERVPDIVAVESDPLKHLRVEDGDAQRAAIRVAQYWKQRRQYFGGGNDDDSNDRWLLPMTQTEGSGALSRDDIAVLRSGYMVLVTLPSDLQIVLIDPSRLKGRDPGEARERCLFYLCTHEVKERSMRSGVEVIFLLTASGFASERHAQLVNVLYGALPTKVRHWTIVQSAQDDGRQELLDFLAFRLSKTLEFLANTRVTVCKATSRSVVLEALERRGIHARYVPKQLGGDYDYTQLDAWVASRLTVEHAMGAALPARNTVPHTFRQMSQRHNHQHALKMAQPAPTVTSILWQDYAQRRRKDSSGSSSHCYAKRKWRKVKRSNSSGSKGSNKKESQTANERLRALIATTLDTSLSDLAL